MSLVPTGFLTQHSMCENPTDWLLDSNFCSFINKTAKTTLIMQFLSITPSVLTRPHSQRHSHRIFNLKKSLLLTGLYTAKLVCGNTAAGKIEAVSQSRILAQLSNFVNAHKGGKLFLILLEGPHSYRISNSTLFHHSLPSLYIFPVSL